METPKLSVISIWYNQASYLESFVDALTIQTMQDFEAIFVDDGSSDDLERKISLACKNAPFKWLYLKRPDIGFTLNTCRNYGLRVSKGKYALLLDGDMVPSEKLIERHYNNLKAGANFSVGSRIRTPHLGLSSDERYDIFMHGSWKAKPYLYAFGCNLAIDRCFLDKHNILFDESYNGKYGMDDIDFAYRCYKARAVFIYDVHASAVHIPDDHPSMNKLSQSMHNYEKFRKYHFVGGIIQSGPVFFEHKYNAQLYQKIIGGEKMRNQDMKIKITSQENKKLTKEVGSGLPTFIIAEAGLNHNGDFEIAKKMVELAAVSGADCVKFQKRDVGQMATRHIYDTTPTPLPELGETYREVRERHELSFEEFKELKKIAESLGLIFMITPFDLQSVEICEKLKVDCYKIASHSMTDLPTLRKVASLRKPLFVSTGMSTPEEIDIAVKNISEYHNNFVLMHCVSSYPQKDEDTHLNMIDYLRDRYKCLVGYSGHEEGIVITEAAVLKRAVAVERHFTLDKRMPGFDHKLSLSPQEIFSMCQDIRRIEKSLGIPEKKVLVSEMAARNAYRRSLVTAKPLRKGHSLVESDLTVKEPGTGIAPYKLAEVLGKKLNVDLGNDTTLEWAHLEK